MRPALPLALLMILLAAGCVTGRTGGLHEVVPSAMPGVALEVPATLYWPPGHGPFPAMALFHGCHGVLEATHAWARWLRDRGYVALVVDSWAARGIVDGCAWDKPDVPSTERFDDAIGALRFLQSQARVDPARIGALGWSNGGVFSIAVVNGPSLERARRRGLAIPEPAYQAAVALYPGGCESLQHDYVVKPLLVLMGDADDWTAPGPCREMVENMRARGAPAELVLYPGVHHYFDVAGLARTFLTTVGNPLRPSGMGATVAFDAAASADAHRRVEAFLARHLGGR